MKNKSLLFIAMSGFIILLAACGGGNTQLSDAAIQSTTQAMVQQTLDAFAATAEISNAPTDEPTSPPSAQAQLIFLWDATEVDENISTKLKSELIPFASANNLEYIESSQTPLSTSPPTGSLIIAYFPKGDLTALAQSVNNAQIIAIDALGIPQDHENHFTLFSIPDASTQGFISGYLSAVITDNYRIGSITLKSETGDIQRDTFRVGGIQFCGLCLPQHPPYNTYPMNINVSPNADDNELLGAAEFLVSQSVNTIYLAPGTSTPLIESYLSEKNIRFVNTTPSPDQPSWAASVSINLSLAEIIPLVLSSGAQGTIRASLQIQNSNHVSDARITHVYLILDEIQLGLIDPLGN